MKYYSRIIGALVVLATLVLPSCQKKLDLFPTNDVTAESIFKDPAGYKNALAKVYTSMAVTGTNGRDIPSEIVSDEGNTGFLRQFWYMQCLTTDEAGWTFFGNTDPIGIHEMKWSASTLAVAGAYYRGYYNITICNNFIIESSDDKLSQRGISGTDAENIRHYRAEARFIRAFNYWALLDMFGNIPFIDDNYVIGSSVLPPQKSKKDIFDFIEKELIAMEADLVAPKTNEYGRLDRAASWALLARLYLNAKVYTGVERNTDAIKASKKVIDEGGYSLHPEYRELMLADNHLNTDEFIWSIVFDGVRVQSYSGTTFLVHGPACADAGLSGAFKDTTGTNGTWNCIRLTEQFVDKFDVKDIRGQFWTSGQQKNMDFLLGDASTAKYGYSSLKFRNKTRTGQLPGSYAASNGVFVDIDFPVFRLAEMYLIYAEAVARGGTGGSNATALDYLKDLAKRARPGDPSAASSASLTLPYILDERGRELFWEGHRRTDLIRYGQFTSGSYLWSWKGGVRSGTAVDSKYNLFPIPTQDLSSNPNLKQNPGY